MIERLWASLRSSAITVQRRVDADHPLDLYADFEPPDRPGLLLLTSERPPAAPSVRSIAIRVGRRQDGRWSLSLMLETPALASVFAELCRDIIEATRTGVPADRAASAMLDRLGRWRRLLEQASPDFTRGMARGLLGELAVLHSVVLPECGPKASVAAWVGPLRQAQDFLLPSGERIEVKAIGQTAETVRISTLHQLDAGGDPITLIAVRLSETSPDAAGALTIGRLAGVLRDRLQGTAGAVEAFERLLRVSGWSVAADDPPLAVRVVSLDWHPVDAGFPRLLPSSVPDGVAEASYVVRLPTPTLVLRPEEWT